VFLISTATIAARCRTFLFPLLFFKNVVRFLDFLLDIYQVEYGNYIQHKIVATKIAVGVVEILFASRQIERRSNIQRYCQHNSA